MRAETPLTATAFRPRAARATPASLCSAATCATPSAPMCIHRGPSAWSAQWLGWRPAHIKITGDVMRASATAWDNHIEAFDLHYWDISADATAADNTGSDQLSKYFFQDRAVPQHHHGLQAEGFPQSLRLLPTDPGYNYTAIYVGIIGSGGATETTALGSTQSIIT